LKFITTKTIALVLLFTIVQLICANAQTIELNKVDVISLNVQVGNMEELNSTENPAFPTEENEMEEHSDYEEVSEKEMLFTKKTVHFVLKAIRVKKKSNKNIKKPSNESLGIIIPPPKA
jgi:hypothetical protein